jgi:hypothetical protein
MVDYKEECRTMLKILTKSEHVYFTPRCNESIRLAFLLAKRLGKSHVLKQDEGGWLTYEKYAKQIDLALTQIVTINGVIPSKELLNYSMDEVLIINSLAGYAASQPMAEITGTCIQQDIFLINDVAGSIGTDLATYGDVIVGSFGDAKPINLGTGGFFATNTKEFAQLFEEVRDAEETELDFASLYKLLKNLEARRNFLEKRCKEIKKDLETYDVVVPEEEHALTVIVRFDTESQKQELITYCEEHDLEYTECPREIRVLDPAISIEVKRLHE